VERAGEAHLTDVTVSIVNTNNRELLLACLASLRTSITGAVGVEIVVLDNASDDGSAAAVAERFPDVRLIAQPFRAGFAANHNSVIRATDGRYVYVLNEDTVSDDWAFARVVAELDAHPRVAALGPRLVYPDGRRQDSAWRFPSPLVSVLGMPSLGRLGIVQSRGGSPRSVDWVMGAALLLRRTALDDVGLFDDGFFIYFEEVDLCRRLRRAGWEVRYFPAVEVAHHESQYSAAVPERRINEMWRGRHRYWRKHHSPFGARVAALATGAQYFGAALAGLAARDDAYRASMLRHARNCGGVVGPGLSELADEWNSRSRE
jgi:N-acetylglucosaminyl-diphospho-decaprenol L-rhamnosyltransferase